MDGWMDGRGGCCLDKQVEVFIIVLSFVTNYLGIDKADQENATMYDARA